MLTLPPGAMACLCLAIAGLAGGCAQYRLPAIDPTGEGLLSGTTAVNTDLRNCPLIPKAAWVPPPYPPKCDQAGKCGIWPFNHDCGEKAVPTGRCDAYLTLTPLQLAAPVGSEVVLTAGLCAPDGYLVTREPVEWSLSPESVGHIVEVGDDRYCLLPPTGSAAAELSPKFALAQTTHKPVVVDRGTPQPDDDVTVKKGQSWISVCSASEGTTYVTALAPRDGDPKDRRQTAAIYWVDAAWTFPPPLVLRAGDKAVLSTTIMRTNGTPVAGWTVRYEVVDGPGAAFSNGQPSIEAATDPTGAAAVELLPTSAVQGITRVRVSIIRPASGRGDAPPIAIGQGFTSVSWTAPGLVVSAHSFPNPVPAGGVVKYRVDVANTGDLVTRDVTLSFTPPTGLSIESSTPAGQAFGDRLEWRLGDIDAKRQASVEVNCRTTRAGDLRATFRATGSGLTAEGHTDTKVVSQAIGLRIEGPDRAIAVGQQAEFKVDITNAGRVPLTNVILTDVFGEGLQHSDGAPSPIRRSLGTMQPGEVKKVLVTFTVRAPGRHCHRVTIESDGGNSAELEACVTGAVAAGPPISQAAPDGESSRVASNPGRLEMRIVAAEEGREGETAAYKVEAVNIGDQPLTNVRIGMAYSENLKPTDASSDFKLGQREIYWTLPRLEPGAKEAFDLNAQILAGAERAAVRASAKADQLAAQTQDAATIVIPATRPEATKSARPMPLPRGELKISIAESANPARIGQTIVYAITVMNEGDAPDEDLALTIQLPEGLKFSRLQRGPGLQAASPDGRSIDVKPIRTLRANERITFSLEVTAQRAGSQRLRVQGVSRNHPDGVMAEKETTIK